jgi:hypothetical protein
LLPSACSNIGAFPLRARMAASRARKSFGRQDHVKANPGLRY